MKIRPEEAEFLQETDMKLTVSLRNFTKIFHTATSHKQV